MTLKKSAPGGGAPRVGGAASFEARLWSGDKEVPQDAYECRWRSETGARFLDAVGSFTNTVIFLRPGRQRIWVEVVPRSGPSQGLSAVSEAVELDVAPAIFSLAAVPAAPLIGEEVTVSIRDFPVRDGVEFRWDPLPAQAKLVRVEERSLTFYATEAVKAPVRVTAVAGGGDTTGGNLGVAKTEVAIRPYSVSVENRGLSETPAIVWRDGEGPVPAEGVAVGQNVRLRAAITPTPQNPPLAFAWGLCSGARARGGEDTREIAASRREVGPCQVSVEVRDARGVLLGRGAGDFTVSVSQATLDEAVAKAREVSRLTQAANDAWAAGDTDKAAEQAGQAVRMSPKDGQSLATLDRIARDKSRLDGYLQRAGAALGGDDFDEVAAMLDEAAKVNARAFPIAALRRKADLRRETLGRVGKLLAEAREKWDAGEVEAALSKVGQAVDLDPGHAEARAERERMVAGRDRLIAALKQAAAYLAGKRFDSAAESLAEARAINPRFAAVNELGKVVAARKERAWRIDERLARARDLWNGGDVDGALATLTEAASHDPEHSGVATARKNIAQGRENLLRAEERADTALGRGKPDEARAALVEAAKINPRHPRLAELQQAVTERAAHDQRLAELRTEAAKRNAAGDLDGALAALGEMLTLAPADAAILAERDKLARVRTAIGEALGRAREFLSGRRYDLALAALAEAEKLSPKLPPLAGWRDKILAEKNRVEAAIAAHLAEAGQQLDKKDFAAARQSLEAARSNGPLPPALTARAKDLERRIEAGRLLADAASQEQRNRDKAAGGAVAGDQKTRCEAMARQASAKRVGGDHAGAIRDYQALLAQCPDTCQAYNNVGASLYSLGYAAESLPWFDEAAKCAPQESLFKDNAALTRKHLAEAAAPPADTASQCATAFETAETRRGGGDLAGAIEGYKHVVAHCPDFCAAYNNMGLSLHKLGRPSESLALFEQARRCNPKDNLFKENYEMTAKRLRTAERRP